MHILNLLVENYKRIKLVEIPRRGRVVKITGANGQGKTSVLDSIWSALAGKRGFPDKPVRKGTARAKIRLELDDLIVTRTITAAGSQSLTVETRKGVQMASPQAILDELIGERTADPQAWVAMKPKEQAEMLRKIANIDYDFEAANAANAAEYEERTVIGRELKRLEGELSSITVNLTLPKEKISEAGILTEINKANDLNRQTAGVIQRKQHLKKQAEDARWLAEESERNIARLEAEMEDIKKRIDQLVSARTSLNSAAVDAEKKYADAPSGDVIDTSPLLSQLQEAQLINREIDKRERRAKLEEAIREQRHRSEDLTRNMERRLEAKMQALQNASLPIPGLAVDEDNVLFEGIPIDQLGEAEQIRIGARILMAQNPKLKVIFIPRGEALDEDSLDILAELAEENDFDIWIAKVDSSGKMGIVIEDGMVAADLQTD